MFIKENKKSTATQSLMERNHKKIKLCFFLNKVNTPFEGILRPFLNWATELRKKKNFEICFVLLNCDDIEDFLEKNLSSVHFKFANSFHELLNYLRIEKPDLVITDDYFPRLRLIMKLKNKIQIRTCIYVQVLHSIHAIADLFTEDTISFNIKMLYALLRIIPFNLLKFPYKRLLLKQDVIIANSQITATLLHMLYGIEPHEIIYPPVDTKIFRDYELEKTSQVLLYLGSRAGDTDQDFIRKICQAVQTKGLEILTLGNKEMQEKLTDLNIIQCLDIADEKLARIYSQCIYTICPQKWETFGYVVAESICCGTPVLAFNCMGIAEIVTRSKQGVLVNNKPDFIKEAQKIGEPIQSLTSKDSYYYFCDTVFSSNKLSNIIEEHLMIR